MKNISRLCLACIAVVVVPHFLCAQDEDVTAPPRAIERVEQFKKIRMMEVLALDEQTSIRFFSRYGAYQEGVRELRKKQAQALGRVQALRKSKAADSEYAKVLEDVQQYDRQLEDAKEKYFKELQGILTSKQIVEYLVFEMRFQQNLRDLIREAQKNRPAPLRW
jgi:hypothetical protein